MTMIKIAIKASDLEPLRLPGTAPRAHLGLHGFILTAVL